MGIRHVVEVEALDTADGAMFDPAALVAAISEMLTLDHGVGSAGSSRQWEMVTPRGTSSP